jgi:hypothetical protein
VTDHDSKNFYTVLVNLANVTYEAASIQRSTSNLGPGRKNGVKPWVELGIIINTTFVCFEWSDLSDMYARLNIFVLLYRALGGFYFWAKVTNC